MWRSPARDFGSLRLHGQLSSAAPAASARSATVTNVGLHLSQFAEADELLTNDPLPLLIGMVLDQRVSERTSGTGRSASA